MQYREDLKWQALERENAQLRRAVEELSMLNDLARELATGHDLQGVLQAVIRRALRAVGGEQGVITLVEETPDASMKTLVRTSASSGAHPAFRPDQHLLGWMQHHKKPLVLNEVRADGRFQDVVWDAAVRSLLCVPMMAHGRLVGILTIYNKVGGQGFSPEDSRLLAIIAAQSAQVVENTRLFEERSQILRIFGQHTSPEVVEELLRRGADTSSRRRHVCVLFLDIRGFTAYAEKQPPEAVVSYLNTLFDFIIALINRHHGVVHQLLGDGLMALFGAPLSHGDDVWNAAQAALAIADRVEAESRAGTIPPTRIGIGLHAGEVVAGTIGSVIHREYTVTGDAVNVAARVEQLNKELDSQVLVSEAVWRAIEGKGVPGEAIGAVDVRGRAGKVRLYRLR